MRGTGRTVLSAYLSSLGYKYIILSLRDQLEGFEKVGSNKEDVLSSMQKWYDSPRLFNLEERKGILPFSSVLPLPYKTATKISFPGTTLNVGSMRCKLLQQ
jgi:hypothetical protein